jgi:hypothetical protein
VQTIPGFKYRFETEFSAIEGVVVFADERLVRLDGGKGILTKTIQSLTPLYTDDFKDFSDEKRAKLAGQGKAMPNGGYPIENAGDVGRAVQAYGRAVASGEGPAVKAHIIKNAKDIGKDATDQLPPDWDGSTQDDGSSQTASIEAPAPTPIRDRIKAAYFAAIVPKPAVEILAAADDDDATPCPTCKGTGKIRDGNMKCPDCGGSGEKS